MCFVCFVQVWGNFIHFIKPLLSRNLGIISKGTDLPHSEVVLRALHRYMHASCASTLPLRHRNPNRTHRQSFRSTRPAPPLIPHGLDPSGRIAAGPGREAGRATERGHILYYTILQYSLVHYIILYFSYTQPRQEQLPRQTPAATSSPGIASAHHIYIYIYIHIHTYTYNAYI